MAGKPQHFFIELLGTRPDWPEHMTPEEERVMGEHFGIPEASGGRAESASGRTLFRSRLRIDYPGNGKRGGSRGHHG